MRRFVPVGGSIWRNIAISVGHVKHDARARLRALVEERHFALVGGFALSNLGSLVIVSGQELGPELFSKDSSIDEEE